MTTRIRRAAFVVAHGRPYVTGVALCSFAPSREKKGET
jgi:hypothetical protein